MNDTTSTTFVPFIFKQYYGHVYLTIVLLFLMEMYNCFDNWLFRNIVMKHPL